MRAGDSELLLRDVREILFREWDPIGVNAYEQCEDEYDSYAPEICRMILERANEQQLAEYLAELAREKMGLPRADLDRDRRVAERLVALGVTWSGTANP